MGTYSERETHNRDLPVEKQVYGVIYEAAKIMPCCLFMHDGHACHGPVTGHHLKTVGSGGRDYMNTIPVCGSLHTLLHGLNGETRVTVEEFYKIDFDETAKDLTLRVVGGHPDDLDY